MSDAKLLNPVKATAVAIDVADHDDDPDETDSVEDERGKPSRSTRRIETVERIFRMAGFLGVTASAILASWQYLESQSKEARAQSLAYIASWQSGPEKEALLRIGQRLSDLAQRPEALAESDAERDIDRARGRIGRIVVDIVLSERNRDLPFPLERDIDSLVDFYSQLEFCIRADICDSALLADYFSRDLSHFWAYMRPFVDYREANLYPGYGEPVKDLMISFGIEHSTE